MKPVTFLLSILFVFSCSSSKINSEMINQQAHVIIYKTTGDYYMNVPITLNDTKDKIVSYPAVSDLTSGSELLLPVKLKKDYLLDKRGISANSVFTSYTYEEYSKLAATPSPEELFNHILDMDPFEVIYDCGKMKHAEDLQKELNAIINENCMSCKEIKTGN